MPRNAPFATFAAVTLLAETTPEQDAPSQLMLFGLIMLIYDMQLKGMDITTEDLMDLAHLPRADVVGLTSALVDSSLLQRKRLPREACHPASSRFSIPASKLSYAGGYLPPQPLHHDFVTRG